VLAQANAVSATSGVETTIVSWEADGVKYLAGFLASGDTAAQVEYRLYIDSTRYYTYKHEGFGSAYMADRAFQPSNGETVYLKVLQSTGSSVTFEGTLLGGA
jgi:hypothetical protein